MRERFPSLRLHKSSGRAVVTLGGTDFYVGAWDTARNAPSREAQKEYERRLGAWIAQGRPKYEPKRAATGAGITVGELCLRYLDDAKEMYRPPSREMEKVRPMAKRLTELFGDMLAVDFGPRALRIVRDRWIADGLCRDHINNRVHLVVRMFRHACGHEWLPPSVLTALESVESLRAGRSAAKESDRRPSVERDIVFRTLPHLRPPVRAIVELMWLTGARPSEICRLRGREIDRTRQRWRYAPKEHKTAAKGQKRVIYFDQRAQEILAEWLRDNPEEPLFQPREDVDRRRREQQNPDRTDHDRARAARDKRRREAALRKAKTGSSRPKSRAPADVYDPRVIARQVREACRKHSIPAWTPYQIRHAVITNTYEEQGIEAASIMAGHSNLTTTERYLHRRDEVAEVVYAARDAGERRALQQRAS